MMFGQCVCSLPTRYIFTGDVYILHLEKWNDNVHHFQPGFAISVRGIIGENVLKSFLGFF